MTESRDQAFDVQHRDWSESLAAMRDVGGADLIVTSAPYPDARTVDQYGGAEFDASVEGYGRLVDAVFESLRPGGVVALNNYVQGDRRSLSTALCCDATPSTIDQEHPAPFARALADAFVLCYSPPGGLVGDPFVGSGTVGTRWSGRGPR